MSIYASEIWSNFFNKPCISQQQMFKYTQPIDKELSSQWNVKFEHIFCIQQKVEEFFQPITAKHETIDFGTERFVGLLGGKVFAVWNQVNAREKWNFKF